MLFLLFGCLLLSYLGLQKSGSSGWLLLGLVLFLHGLFFDQLFYLDNLAFENFCFLCNLESVKILFVLERPVSFDLLKVIRVH